MLHTGKSLFIIVRGNLNIERDVRPPGNNVAAIPDDATHNAIFPSCLIFDNNYFNINVLPVLPGASIKNNLPSW